MGIKDNDIKHGYITTILIPYAIKWGIIHYNHVSHLRSVSMLNLHGFLDPEFPNFDPNYASLNSIEAEIITFLLEKAEILVFRFLRPSYEYFNVAPLPELKIMSQRPLIPKLLLLSAL